jgi:predicted nucleotide-binding protein
MARPVGKQDTREELLQIAHSARSLLGRIRDEEVNNPVVAIQKACDEIKKAWSGSNIGYHATVYFAGLVPKPPNAQFSVEWGLKDRWPTHQPHPGWQIFDEQFVLEEIQRRAGNPDLGALEHELVRIRERFFSLQDRAKSVLTALKHKDSFLEEKLARVSQLIAPVPSFITQDLVPKGQIWSRDSLAVTQGLRPAPHQTAVGLPLSAITLKNGIDALEKAVRESAAHMERVGLVTPKKIATVGNEIFIGHGRSPLWRELKDFLEDRLDLTAVEFNSVSVAGVATTDRLKELLDGAAFAFLLMTGEDEQIDGKVRARENVVHEVGLFQGRLGFNRAIVLLEDGCEEFSNIHGLGQIRFPKRNIAAKFEEIRAVLEREDVIKRG